MSSPTEKLLHPKGRFWSSVGSQAFNPAPAGQNSTEEQHNHQRDTTEIMVIFLSDDLTEAHQVGEE